MECNGEDLLTECKNLTNTINMPNVSEGHHNKYTIRNAILSEYDKEIKAILLETKKVNYIWEYNRSKRNYLTRMNLDDARVWFR